MASTDKINFAVSVTPIEGVGAAQQGSAISYIIASETAGAVGGSGTVTELETGFDATGGVAHGYASGVKQYVSSAAATTPTAFSALAGVEFMIIKHTGFRYASATTLGVVNTTDYLTIRALNGSDGTAVTGASGLDAGEEPLIAVLKAGEGIVLPLRGGDAGAGDVPSAAFFGHHSTTIANNVAGGNTIAIELIAVK